MEHKALPLPSFYDPDKVRSVWSVPYQERAEEAVAWRRQHGIRPASEDRFRVCLIAVDVQNTFCLPEFELFVGGRSGTGAIDDNRRLCEFIYRNLNVITQITPTMDTHQAIQIFHSIFLVDENGEHPAPYTLISAEDIRSGRWRFNAAAGASLGISPEYGQRYLQHYVEQLEKSGKYQLTIWPYHAMLGGIGHALVSAVEEAIFFHAVARYSQPDFIIKGNHPLTEHYSALGPEVNRDHEGKVLVKKNERLVNKLREFDMVLVAGQAKSHCVAWTVSDLIASVPEQEKGLLDRLYLLEDCSSPVVVPGALDYTEAADRAYREFEKQGAHIVRSAEPLESWPGVAEKMASKGDTGTGK